MRVAYFEPFGGASGNMILGSLVDAGLSRQLLERELRRLPLTGWTMHAATVHKRGLGALYLDVEVAGEDGCAPASAGGSHRHEGSAHRRLADVLEVVRAAGYGRAVEDRASAIFRRLAAAEARVHRQPVEDVVFHEVGQVDAIVDIAGAALALDLLGIDRVYCAPLPCGRG
ncbi:MAG: LarC family nickel insertion protein, partial [Candidatus Eremiobacteraeota bacterium]|nr:LarC family nickel insertion protein [Candidatus Eremiobacteraeota bacterium]